jgi:hypothetical protein
MKSKKITNFSKLDLRSGDGGSWNLIHIGKQCAYKIIFFYVKSPNSITRVDNDQQEIQTYKILTNEFVLTNKSPHIVSMIDTYKINIEHLFLGLPTIEKIYLTRSTFIQQRLSFMRFQFNKHTLKSIADVAVLEKCPLTIPGQLSKILSSRSKNKMQNIIDFIDRIVFQVVFTLAVIQDKYPTFVHNDFFLRNVLAVEEKKGKYIEYSYKSHKFYLPSGFMIKINDFGYTLDKSKFTSSLKKEANSRLISMPNINCKKCDIFNFLHDLYDGETLGVTSLQNGLDNKQFKIVKQTINKYIDTDILDKILNNNDDMLRNLWSIYHITFLQKIVKEPHEYLISGFKKFKKIPAKIHVKYGI